MDTNYRIVKGFCKLFSFMCIINGSTTLRLPIYATITPPSTLQILFNYAALIGKQPSQIYPDRRQGRVLGAIVIFFNCLTTFYAETPVSIRHKGSRMPFLREKKKDLQREYHPCAFLSFSYCTRRATRFKML